MSNEVTTEIPLKVNVTVAADDAVVSSSAEPAPEEEATPPDPEPEPVSEPEPVNNDIWRPEPRRRWLSGRNIFFVLLLAAIVVMGYYFWQGQGAFVAIERGVEPFTVSSELIQPQDISNSTIILEEYFTKPRGKLRPAMREDNRPGAVHDRTQPATVECRGDMGRRASLAAVAGD